MLRSVVCVLISASALLLAPVACKPLAGDPCEKNTDCGREGLVCDLAQPSGYCTLTPCLPNGCPDESACIDFGERRTWCMKICESNDDCRDGYACVKKGGQPAFCGVS